MWLTKSGRDMIDSRRTVAACNESKDSAVTVHRAKVTTAFLMCRAFLMCFCLSRCAIPGLANDTWQTQNDHHAILVDAFVPPADLHTRSSCYLFSDVSEHLRGNWSSYGGDWRSVRWSGHLSDSGTDDTVSHQPSSGAATNGTVTCSRYVYDTSTYASSVSMEVCACVFSVSFCWLVLFTNNDNSSCSCTAP